MNLPSRVMFQIVVPAALLALCGCGSHTTAANMVPVGGTPTTSPVNTPIVVNLAAGQSLTGTDITVSLPASSTAPNAQVLGVTTTTQGSADNTGAIVTRGSVVTVLLFGPGLSANMQVSISGPSDIAIAQIQGIQSTTGTPGIAFQAIVASNAALGARTVTLQASNGDITTFTGGLEVQ